MANTGEQPIAKILSPEAYCFIIDIDEGPASKLEFQLMPENISESKTAFYNEIPIIGRSLPHLGYSGSSSRQISLNLNFAALYYPGTGYYDVHWVEKQVRWLESKVYPVYRGNFTFPPHRLLIILGQAVRMQAVMTSCSTSWQGPWAVNTEGDGKAYSHRATIDCAFQEYGENDAASGHPHDHYDAIEGRNQADSASGQGDYVEIPIAAQAPLLTPGGNFGNIAGG